MCTATKITINSTVYPPLFTYFTGTHVLDGLSKGHEIISNFSPLRRYMYNLRTHVYTFNRCTTRIRLNTWLNKICNPCDIRPTDYVFLKYVFS